jgi:hypothetical protein
MNEEQIVRRLEALLQRMKEANDRRAVVLPSGDLRLAIVGLPGNTLHSYLLHFAMAVYTITDKRWWATAYKKDEPSATDIAAMRNLEAMTKHATFVFFMSRIEWNSRKLLSFLYPGACGQAGAAFKTVYDYLLTKLGLERYIPLYDLARHLRNSVHSNGVHISRSGWDETVVWRGRDYHLRHMKDVDFASHETLFVLYEDLVSSLEDIIAVPAVSTPRFIEDRIH